MKTSEGVICPVCGGRVSRDRKHKGFVRHLRRLGGVLCRYGRGERD